MYRDLGHWISKRLLNNWNPIQSIEGTSFAQGLISPICLNPPIFMWAGRNLQICFCSMHPASFIITIAYLSHWGIQIIHDHQHNGSSWLGLARIVFDGVCSEMVFIRLQESHKGLIRVTTTTKHTTEIFLHANTFLWVTGFYSEGIKKMKEKVQIWYDMYINRKTRFQLLSELSKEKKKITFSLSFAESVNHNRL